MARLRLTLLGDFQARLGPGPPLRLRARKTQALLAYLALPAGRLHSRDKLAAVLWGDGSPHHARSRLRETLFVLRRILAPADPSCLSVNNETVGLEADAADVDAVVFERLVERGGAEALADAVDLYRGDLLEGFEFRGALFEDWLMAERERLRELALDALAKLLANQRSTGSAEAALKTALRLIALDPLQESVHRTLMRLYVDLGRRAASLRQYQLCVGVLQRELGVEPEADTSQLYQEILRRTPQRGAGAGTIPTITEHRPAPPMIAATTPLIGRAGEMTQLREALARARAGTGQLLVIDGEAGVGKTRLIGEIATEALRLGVRLLLGRCYESDQILPFGPWVDALRTAGITLDRPLLDELAPPSRADLARILPEVEAPGLPAPSDNQLRLFESVAQLMERLAAREPVLFVLEDLHWADDISLRLLAFVSRRVAGWRALLLATARGEELADSPATHHRVQELFRTHPTVHMPLLPLSRPETLSLVKSLARAGADASAIARLQEQVWTVSEGNPFVAVETTRAVQEGTIPPNAETLPMPERVRELITSRLEHLSTRARELAAVAAVIGREFEFPLLRQASGLDEAWTAEGVEELVRRRVLQGIGDRFEFVHHRIQTVVYYRILPHRRKLLHRSAGEALEELSPEDLERDPLPMGLHFREAEVWGKAVFHMWRAGTRAAARSAYRQAVVCFEEALAALRHLPETRETLAQAVDLHLEARAALNPLREMDAILAHLRAAEATAVTLGDPRRLAAVLTSLTNYFSELSEIVQGLEAGQRAVDLADALDDFGLRVATNLNLAMVHLDRGTYRDAKAILSRLNIAELQGDLARERFGMSSSASVFYHYMLGYCQAELGEFIDAVARGQDAVRVAEEIEQPYACTLAHVWLGRIYFVQGEFAQASREWKAGFDIVQARQLGVPVGAGLGYAQVMSGDIANGLSLLETEVARLLSTKWFGRKGVVSAWLGEAYMTAGRLVEASDAAQRGLALLREKHQRGYEAMTLRLLGDIAMHGPRPDAVGAEKLYRQALALAEDLGMRPLAARCCLGLGRLYLLLDKRSPAQGHLATARAMLAQMGIRLWLEEAEEALQALV